MANVPQSFRVLGQTPLDEKLIFASQQSLFSHISNNPRYAFDFYKGMMVYLQQEEKFYIWERPNSEHFIENDKLLTQNFIYPSGSVYNGFNYSNKAFNLIELPYKKENLGLWDPDPDAKMITVEIYTDGTVNPFVIQEVLDLWPNADRLAFIDNDITGLKLYGQTLSLFQVFPVSDWDNLTYDIWNPNGNYIQDAKLKILEAGETLVIGPPFSGIDGNSFKELKIVQNELEMRHKNSMYFKPVEDSFEIYVKDKGGFLRKLSGGSGSGVMINEDQTLRINGNTINSNVGITESNFYSQTIITLPFVPAQILGVFVGGLKLPDTGAYTLTLPHTIQFHVNTQGKHINIQFSYLLT